MQKETRTTSSDGYAILFAVLLVSIILAITLGILNIAIKEFNFTATAKNSHVSFFAADTGGECALYGRKQGMLENTSPVMLCDTQTITSTTTTVATNITQYNFSDINVQNGCARVDIVVDDSDALVRRTTINSRGYNVTCAILQSVNPSTKIERLLSFEFTEGVNGGTGGVGTGSGTGNQTTSGSPGGLQGTPIGTVTPINPGGNLNLGGTIMQNFGTSAN
jgi:hypothetical protein